jgi:hypothetical protein
MSDSRIRRSERDVVERVKGAWWIAQLHVRISRWWPNAVRQAQNRQPAVAGMPPPDGAGYHCTAQQQLTIPLCHTARC